jgi:hypothetical protein
MNRIAHVFNLAGKVDRLSTRPNLMKGPGTKPAVLKAVQPLLGLHAKLLQHCH